MAKQNKEYVYVDCYQCDENGKSSPWKRKHLDDVPKWQHEEAKDFNCFATVQKYANEKKIYRNRTYIFTFPGLRASIFW